MATIDRSGLIGCLRAGSACLMGNRRLVVVTILCAGCMAGTAGWAMHLHRQWSTPERLIQRAALAVQKNELGRAQILIRNAIREAPDNVEARVQVANILNLVSDDRQPGDVPAAVEQIAVAARLRPDDVDLQNRLFAGWTGLGRHEAALTTARKAVELGSNSASVLRAVVDAELDAGNLESAEEVLDRLARVVPEESPALIARQLRLFEASGDTAAIQVECDALLQRLLDASDSELAEIEPGIMGVVPFVMARSAEAAGDTASVPAATRAIRLVRRLLAAHPDAQSHWPLIELSQRLTAESLQFDRDADPTARRELCREFVQLGDWLLNSSTYVSRLTPQFAVLACHTAIVAEAPEIAIGILPRLVERRSMEASWKLTASQQSAIAAYHLTALAQVFGTKDDEAARTGIGVLLRHTGTTSLADLFRAFLAVLKGETKPAREALAEAAADPRIDQKLISAVRCRCDMRDANWRAVASTIERFEQEDMNPAQAALLTAVLGTPEQRRLILMTALLESGRNDNANTVLESFEGSGLRLHAQVLRLLHDLSEGRLQDARERLRAARRTSPRATSLVIADAAIAIALGDSDGVESRMNQFLAEQNDDVRVRTLLARSLLSSGRIDDALQQYLELTVRSPEHIHGWVMAAVLLQMNARHGDVNLLLERMAETEPVASSAPRLRNQISSFAIRLRRNDIDFERALEAVDLLHDDSAQAVADWKLMTVALNAARGNTPLHALARLEFSVQTPSATRPAGQSTLDRLESAMQVTLIDVADSDADEVLGRIEALVGRYPRQAGPRVAAIIYFAGRNDVSTAWKHTEVLAQIDTGSGRAQYWFARLLAATFRIDEAAVQVESSLQFADRPETRLLGTRIELFRNRPEQALEHLNQLPRRVAAQAVPTLLRFQTLARMARNEAAARVLTELLSREPQHVAIWLTCSEYLESEYGVDRAIRMTNSALLHHPHDSRLRARLLTLLVRSGRHDQARTLAQQLAETSDHPESPLALALTFLQAGALAEGEAWLKRVAPETAPSFQYAMAVYQQGLLRDDADAINRAGMLLEQRALETPDSLALLNNLAWLVAVDLDEPQAALPYVERMMALNARTAFDPSFVDTIAEVLLRNGRHSEALNVVQRSVLRFPENRMLRYHRGVLQLSLPHTATQTRQALQDLALARRWAGLSPARDARAAELLQHYRTAP